MMELILPWPPSVNHYWRKWRNRMVISKEGREFRRRVERLCAAPAGVFDNGNKKPPRIALCMDAYPPDRRRRDLDNLLKSTQDSLAHAGFYLDDSQIDILLVRRCEPKKPGMLSVEILQLPLSRCPLCGNKFPTNESESKNAKFN